MQNKAFAFKMYISNTSRTTLPFRGKGYAGSILSTIFLEPDERLELIDAFFTFFFSRPKRFAIMLFFGGESSSTILCVAVTTHTMRSNSSFVSMYRIVAPPIEFYFTPQLPEVECFGCSASSDSLPSFCLKDFWFKIRDTKILLHL